MTSLESANDKAPLPALTHESPTLIQWQQQLLPFMTRFIVLMAIAFFAMSLLNLYQVKVSIETEHGVDIRTEIHELVTKQILVPPTSDQVIQQSLLLLEAEALEKRYHQANALLLSRIWTRQLAFITGTIVVFVGSIFILGKMSEATSEVTGGTNLWHAGISSASPGIILAFLGTLLLVISLVAQTKIDVHDSPVYLYTVPAKSQLLQAPGSLAPSPAQGTVTNPPKDILDGISDNRQKQQPAGVARH